MSTSHMEGKYNPKLRELTIKFKNGDVRTYEDVPPGIAKNFLEAVSKGAFFNAYIRNDYKERKADAKI